MKIIKKTLTDVPKETAHAGAGSRRLYIDKGQINNQGFEALTHGYLPAGRSFDWHLHEDIEEIMLILKGNGIVSDPEGEYEYEKGDLFIFPANIEHKIVNPSQEEHEMIFIRVHN